MSDEDFDEEPELDDDDEDGHEDHVRLALHEPGPHWTGREPGRELERERRDL